MTMIDTRTPDFPANPSDGFQIKEELPDGNGYIIWTYNALYNEWTNEVFKAGIQGYLYTDQVRTVPTEVTTVDGDKERLETQEQVNNFIADTSTRAVKASGRTADQVDFLQNSIAKGTWDHVIAGVGFPQTGEFWTGGNESDFAKIDKIIVNEQGYSTEVQGSFAHARIGDYLTIQERNTPSFGMYVISGIAVQVIEEQTIREYDLLLIENRAAGSTLVHSSRCQITTSRPTYVVVQDTEPLVSHRGTLWYRESDDVLSISNYETGFTGNGPQWTEINGAGSGDGGGGVKYLPLSGGTANKMTGILYLGGNKIAGVGNPELATDAATRGFVETYTLQPDKANDITTAFRVRADGKTLISSSGNELGLFNLKEPSAPSHAATQGYVDGKIDEKIAAIPEPEVSGGSFQTKYDGNRFCKVNAVSTTTVSSGEVIYLNNQLVSTTQPALVEIIGLPLDEFNWESCLKSGVIKVNNGANEAGYYQVFKTKETSGCNMLVYVKPLWSDMDQSLQEGGTPCYFQGMFFE